MHKEALDNSLALSTVNAFRRVWKSLPWRKPRPVEDHLRDELERLALLSPHLLADLGFTQDAAASVPDTKVWRYGRHRVVVARPTSLAFATTN